MAYQILKQSWEKTAGYGETLLELPPSRRNLFFDLPARGLIQTQNFFVSLPKIRLLIRYEQCNGGKQFFVRTTYICFVNSHNEILIPPLPNIFDNLKICCKGEISDSVESLIENQIVAIFNSSFNNDILEMLYVHYKNEFRSETTDFTNDYVCSHKIINYMQEWSKKTKADPNWIPEDFKKLNIRHRTYTLLFVPHENYLNVENLQ